MDVSCGCTMVSDPMCILLCDVLVKIKDHEEKSYLKNTKSH